jgi:hypothetical protein
VQLESLRVVVAGLRFHAAEDRGCDVRLQALPGAAGGPRDEFVPNPQVLNRYAYARDTPLRYTGGQATRRLLPRPARRTSMKGGAPGEPAQVDESGGEVTVEP